MPTKLLVLGVDAASPDLLRRWAADGKLPAIRALMDRGASGLVSGVRGFFIGATWPSFYTGLSPAGHGFYRIDQLKSGSYDFFRPLDSSLGIGGTPFWKLASNAGRRVAVLDVPLSRLEADLNGLQVVEWGGHDAVFGFQCSPPAVADEIMSCMGAYPLPTACDGLRRSAADFEAFVTGLERAAAKKTELTLEFLKRERWDLLVQVFTETHCAGHQCWHIHDSTHPAHDAGLLAALGDPLERVYRAVDRAVAQIIDRAGDAKILLVSAHGMGPFRGAAFLLPEILYRLGVTAEPPGAKSQPPDLGDRLIGAARTLWKTLPDGARHSLGPLWKRLMPRNPAPVKQHGIAADVANSRCFPIPNGFPIGGIRLNLKGREPQGILEPGPETDAFCDQLTRDFYDIVDERSGRPLIAAVHRTDTLYRGPRRDALPDLLVEWNGDSATGSVALANGRGSVIRATSVKIGTVEGCNRYGRSGEHLPTGMFLYAGPGVPALHRQQPVSVMDFCPTLCALLDVPVPNVDGMVIPELAAPSGRA